MTDTLTVTYSMAGVQFMVPDAGTAADAALQEGLAYCADRMRLTSVEAAIEQLHQGNRPARSYFEYGLAKGLAEQLGGLDDEVQAAYIYDADATAEDVIFGQAVPTLVHVIVYARRKTNALGSLLTALDRELVSSYAERMHCPDLMHLVDIQVVDDEEIANKIGYGALLTSLHHRPLPIWKR